METALAPRPRPRCIHSGRLAVSTSACRWPRGTIISWWVDPTSRFGTLSPDQIGQALTAAVSPWPQICGAKVLRVYSRDQARVLISSAPIDRLNGILGQTQLPCDGRADVQRTMVFDSAEPWTPRMLFQVGLHEWGHELGIGHAPANVRSVMGEYYDPELEQLQPWEIGQAVEKCGPPEVASQPSTPQVIESSIVLQPFDIKLTIDQPGDYLVRVIPSFKIQSKRV